MISFILPTRNTVLYTQRAYQSLRKYNPTAEIILLDDLSTDGTLEYLDTLIDDNLVIYKNNPVNFPKTYDYQKFSGHTILYNFGVEMAKNKIVSLFQGVTDLMPLGKYPDTIILAVRIYIFS